MTGVAYGAAVLFYQAATFSEHPLASFRWIMAIFAVFTLVVMALRGYGKWWITPQRTRLIHPTREEAHESSKY